MEADHPAKRLRVRVTARGIAACSSNAQRTAAQRCAEGRPPRQRATVAGAPRCAKRYASRQAP
eukprot:3517932-Prymnesium_polylepis.1